MEIIKDNYSKTETKVVSDNYTCEKCQSVLNVSASDIKIGQYGMYQWTCPLCNNQNYVDEGIELTANNIEFPTHFATYKNGKQINNNELNKWVKECITNINKDCDYSMHASGNSFVLAYKSNEETEVSVIVCDNGYYETFLDKRI